MQTFLGHVVDRAGLACNPERLSAVWAWHTSGSVKQVHQFIGFVGYYRHFIQDFAGLSEPLVALTRQGTVFAWTSERQDAFKALKSCLLPAPILGFPTESDRFVLDTYASLFVVGGILNQIQGEREVVIAHASRRLRQSQRGYYATRREMFAAVMMCSHFRFYLRGV